MVLETIEELIIYIDLDNFKRISQEKGWISYRPNEITGTLTHLIRDFVRRHHAEVLFGLDEKRGTEECMLRLTGVLSYEKIIQDLQRILNKIKEIGEVCNCDATVSIGVARGPFTERKPTGPNQWSRTAIKGYTQRLARKALKKAKKQGGNRIVFL